MKKLQVYITDEQYQKVRSLAYKEYATMSHILRWCIDSYPEKSARELEIEIEDKFLEELKIRQEKLIAKNKSQ